MPSEDPTKPTHPADAYKLESEQAVKKGSIIVTFEDETRVFDLLSPETRISIGRGSDMDVIVDDESLSRLHARFIYKSDKGLNVTDLGSRNGTVVNGRVLKENDSAFLRSGDEVLMGAVRAVVALMGERSRMKPPAKFTMRKIPGAQDLVVLNPAMKAVYQQVAAVAVHDSPVQITGETGTGKEHVAAALHAAGPKSKKPFVTVNCGAIPTDLVESVFFGHEKGAFTSATTSRVGVFDTASGGALFLDEVGELPWDAQASLLRAVETGRITLDRINDKPKQNIFNL